MYRYLAPGWQSNRPDKLEDFLQPLHIELYRGRLASPNPGWCRYVKLNTPVFYLCFTFEESTWFSLRLPVDEGYFILVVVDFSGLAKQTLLKRDPIPLLTFPAQPTPESTSLTL